MSNIKLFRNYIGYVNILVSGDNRAQFISELFRDRINVWDIKKDGNNVSMCVNPSCYKQVVRIAKANRCKVRVNKRYGFVFVLNKYRNRLGLLIGVMIFSSFLIIMSKFVWSIEIVGNDKISSGAIMETLYNNGVKVGTLMNVLPLSEIEQKVLLELPELSWVGMTKSGSKLVVSVSERINATYVVPLNHPCNIVAKRDAWIVNTEVYKGQLIVQKGSGVKKGGLIVSGIVEDPAGNIIYEHSDAKIIAEYTENKEFYLPYSNKELFADGKVSKRKYLIAFGNTIPLFFTSPRTDNILYSEEDKEMKLFGLSLPFKMKTGSYTEYTERVVTYSEEEAMYKLKKQAVEFEENFYNDCEVVSREEKFITTEEGVKLVMCYTIRADIAQKEEILLYYESNTAKNSP